MGISHLNYPADRTFSVHSQQLCAKRDEAFWYAFPQQARLRYMVMPIDGLRGHAGAWA